MLVFRKIWRDLFSGNTRFEIRPFALIPTNSLNENTASLRTRLMSKEIKVHNLPNNFEIKLEFKV